jgi:hypothetical protein
LKPFLVLHKYEQTNQPLKQQEAIFYLPHCFELCVTSINSTKKKPQKPQRTMATTIGATTVGVTPVTPGNQVAQVAPSVGNESITMSQSMDSINTTPEEEVS